MPHLVLLGDSIFDNGAYVPGGPPVIRQVQEELPGGWHATLRALDGAVVGDVVGQIPRIPRDATHLALSAGGNDALAQIDILDLPARSVAEVLDLLAAIGHAFEQRYRAAVASLLALHLPLVLCTIYDGNLPDPELQRRASTALTIFNDVILRTAAAEGIPVVELRNVCTESADYANPIEPSVAGGRKIARALVAAVLNRI